MAGLDFWGNAKYNEPPVYAKYEDFLYFDKEKWKKAAEEYQQFRLKTRETEDGLLRDGKYE